jgi:type II secretory pathway predicted ATPase ExeA
MGVRTLGVITGEVGAARPSRSGLRSHSWTTPVTRSSTGQPRRRRDRIHHAIVASFAASPRPHKSTLVPQATDLLATENNERCRVPVLIIEEAHLLDHEQLEAIRMLTNGEIDSNSPWPDC